MGEFVSRLNENSEGHASSVSNAGEASPTEGKKEVGNLQVAQITANGKSAHGNREATSSMRFWRSISSKRFFSSIALV